MKSPLPSSRALAAQVVNRVLAQGESLTSALATLPAALPANDRALVQELSYGVCRYAHQLDGIARALMQKPIKAKEQVVHALLLVGLYQLLHTRIPDHAAISATVEVTRELKKPWATGLLNGVLRRVQRAQTQSSQPWPKSAQITSSHPQWLLDKLQNAWPEHWQAVVEANNKQAPMWLRVNASRISRENYLQKLQEADIAAEPSHFADHAVRLVNAHPVADLPGFNEGLVSVQDEAAQLSASLLELAPGQRVLDACSAPGGKTCHILEACTDLKEVVAVELEAARLTKVQENLQRLELQATLKQADASDLAAWWDGVAFDRILLDAPCSATGVIRRHPDIKWLRRPSDIDKLAALQLELLHKLWQTLAPGGLLVYATCSVLPEENEHTLTRFLAETRDASTLPIVATWGLPQQVGRQLLPQANGHDGFYYACLRKQG